MNTETQQQNEERQFRFEYRSCNKDLSVSLYAASLNDAMVFFATRYHFIDTVFSIVDEKEPVQQPTPASQPPPLTQGRMYVEVSDAEKKKIARDGFDACFDFKTLKPKDYSVKELERDIITAVEEGISLYIEHCKSVPHTPAPAVSDAELPIKFAIWLRENHSTKEKWDNVSLDADMWRDFDSSEEKSTEQLYKHWKENIYKAAATPAPIAIDGEAEQAAIIHDMRENMVLGWTNEELTKLYLITKK